MFAGAKGVLSFISSYYITHIHTRARAHTYTHIIHVCVVGGGGLIPFKLQLSAICISNVVVVLSPFGCCCQFADGSVLAAAFILSLMIVF